MTVRLHKVRVTTLPALAVLSLFIQAAAAETPASLGIGNGSFEYADPNNPTLPLEWAPWLSPDAEGTVELTAQEKTEGQRSLQMTYKQGWQADRWVRAVHRFSGLELGVPYSLTGWAKQVSGEGAHRGLILFLGNRWTCFDLLADQWEKAWKQFTVPFTLNPDDIDASGNVLLVVQLDVPGVYCIDDLRIQPYNPIEIVPAQRLAEKKVYLVRQEPAAATPAASIPSDLPVYSIGADTEHKSTPEIKDDQDLSAAFALAYSDRGLHLYVDVTDDAIVAGQDYLSLTPIKAEGMYNCDSIQIAIDQGLDRTPHWDGNDQEIGLAPGPTPETQLAWCWTIGRAPTARECDFTVTRTAKGYFIEAVLSWTFLNAIDRKDRRAFGFNLIVNDNDGQGRKGWIFLSKGIGDAKSTEDNLIAILDDGQPNVVGVFKKEYVGGAGGPLFLCGMDQLNGRRFDVVVEDQAGRRKSLLYHPIQLDLPTNAVGRLDTAFGLDEFQSGPIAVRCLADDLPVKTFDFCKLDVKETIESIEKQTADLWERTTELQRRGLPTGYLQSKLAVLSSQARFARDNLADYQANGSAYYLGKATRRISELESLLAMAKAECDAIAEDRITDRFRTYRYVSSPIAMVDGYPNAKTVDDFGHTAVRPVVFNGYCMNIDWNIDTHPAEGTAVFVKENGETVEAAGDVGEIVDSPNLANSSMSFFANLPLFKAMGGNAMIEMCKPTWAAQVYNLDFPPNFAQPQSLYEMAKGIKGPFYYNSFRDRFSRFYQSAYDSDFIITYNLWAVHLLPWVYDAHPELRIPSECGGGSFGWFNYQINTPAAKRILGFLVENVVREIRDDPHANVVHSIDIANETAFTGGLYDSPVQRAMFLTHLKAKYGEDIGTLNAVWKTQFRSFEEILPENVQGLVPENRVLWWEWHIWAQEMFSDWHQWLADVVREAWPAARVYAKPIAAGFARSYSGSVDFERFAEWSDLNSCDVFLYYNEGDYRCTWLDAALNYDLLCSLKPAAIINAENHIIRDAEGRDIPYDYVYACLFQQYMHGLALSSTWSWMEQREDSGYHHTKGLFAERPMCIAALNQATLDANRLIHEIKAFFDAKPQIAILYSPTAMIKDTQYPRPEDNYDAAGIEAYKQLSFMGHKIGFISEKQIARGEFGELEVIVAPNAVHVLPATAERLMEFTGRGKAVISIGRSLAKDPYENHLEFSVPMVELAANEKFQGLGEAMKVAVETRMGKLPAEVTVDGGIPDGIEWRLVRDGDGYLLNIVNYNRDAREVAIDHRIKMKDEMLDLIRHEPVSSAFVLEPLRPMLIRMRGLE